MTDMLTAADLAGRVARCTCGAERPSVEALEGKLAFFAFCGEGSYDASMCVCGYAECAHDPEYMATLVPGRDGRPRPTVVERGNCVGFVARGGRDHDRWYCGCKGWN